MSFYCNQNRCERCCNNRWNPFGRCCIGPMGPRGPRGPRGFPGSQGLIGPQGLTGPQGIQGIRGAIGLTGEEGPQGPIGLTGLQGPTGLTGADGPQGPTGLTGAEGHQGERGLTGAEGPQGPIGLTGPQGPTGLTGPQGPTGLTGLQGPQGPAGLTGAQGPQGLAGIDGVNGTDGARGSAGPCDGMYAGSYGETFIATVGIIPMEEISATDPTTMSVSGNAIDIGVGSYLVTYSFVAQRSTDGEISMSLYMGGSAVTNETIIESAPEDMDATASKTIIVNAATATTLQLYNNTAITGQTVTYTSATITALKIC